MDTTEIAGRRYTLGELLGEGGFGEVYRAVMTGASGLRQDVAVKLLRPELDPRSQPVARLRDEARVLASLQHPVILQVRDLVSLDGRAALVTEHVPGRDLEQVLATTGPVPARVALEIVGHVADALDAAFHAISPDGVPLRLVHRDVKPANIRVTPHGTVKLLDFGLARAEELERETTTSAMTLLGSVPYMGPESLHMDETQPGMARDVYALGVTLFELLTGERVYGDMNRGEQRRQTARPERVAEFWGSRKALLAAESPDLVALIESMLAYAVGDRPSAREVADAAFPLAETLSAPALRGWARAQGWADDQGSTGAWSGRTLSDGVHHSAAQTMVLPPEETADPLPDLPVFDPDAEGPPVVRRRPWLWFAMGGGLMMGASISFGLSDGPGLDARPPVELGGAAVAAEAVPAEAAAEAPAPEAARGTEAPDGEGSDPAPDPTPAEPDSTPAAPKAKAPVRRPRPTVRPEPEPEPEPEPAPKPAPAPASPTGRVVNATPDVPVRLWDGRRAQRLGAVDVGRWGVQADFGDGWTDVPGIQVREGRTVTVSCSRLAYTCTVSR